MPHGDGQVKAIARRIADTWAGIKQGQFVPERVADCAYPTTLLKKIWNDHRRLAGALEVAWGIGQSW